MHRYVFKLDGHPRYADEVVTVLKGPEQARAEAVINAGEMLRDIDGQFWNEPEWRLHVIDEHGTTV